MLKLSFRFRSLNKEEQDLSNSLRNFWQLMESVGASTSIHIYGETN